MSKVKFNKITATAISLHCWLYYLHLQSNGTLRKTIVRKGILEEKEKNKQNSTVFKQHFKKNNMQNGIFKCDIICGKKGGNEIIKLGPNLTVFYRINWGR